MSYGITANGRITEHSFYWGKKLGFLTLKTLNSKLEIKNLSLKIDIDKYYFGLIKGKRNTYSIPLNSIDKLEVKTLLSFSELLVTAIYFLGGIFLNPLFFLIVPISVYACINTHVLISTKKNGVIKIPSYNKKDASEFIQYFYEIYI